MQLNSDLVVAVTPRGPLRFNSIDEAISHPLVGLADPIFLEGYPIDRTLIRGPHLDGLEPDTDPWTFLVERALDPATVPQDGPRRGPKPKLLKAARKIETGTIAGVLSDESLSPEEKIAALVAALAAPPPTAASGEPNPDLLNVRRRGRPPGGLKYHPDWIIRLLIDDNPRQGAARHRFKIYRDGMTIQEFLDAGGDRKDLSYDTAPERNYIRVEAPNSDT